MVCFVVLVNRFFSESKDFSQDSANVETPVFGAAEKASEVKLDSCCHVFLSIYYHYTTDPQKRKGFFYFYFRTLGKVGTLLEPVFM